MQQQAANNGVNTDRLAGTGSPGDQEVGHFGQIADHRFASRAFPQSQGQFGLGLHLLKDIGFNHAAQADHPDIGIGDFNSHHRLTRHRGFDTDAGRRQSQRQIVGEGGNPVHLDPGLGDLFYP